MRSRAWADVVPSGRARANPLTSTVAASPGVQVPWWGKTSSQVNSPSRRHSSVPLPTLRRRNCPRTTSEGPMSPKSRWWGSTSSRGLTISARRSRLATPPSLARYKARSTRRALPWVLVGVRSVSLISTSSLPAQVIWVGSTVSHGMRDTNSTCSGVTPWLLTLKESTPSWPGSRVPKSRGQRSTWSRGRRTARWTARVR